MQQISDYLNQLKQKEVIILGLGKEGVSSYNFIRQYLPNKKIWLVDEKELSELDQIWKEVSQTDLQTQFLTKLDKEDFANKSLVVFKAPGIPPHSNLLKQISKLKVQLTSNTNLFFTLIKLINTKLKNDENKIKTIGVTGTKGKSTTSAVIAHTLTTAGLTTLLGGNIGIAPLSLIDKVINSIKNNHSNKEIYVVLELSCHQLNDLKHSPNYAVILDISQEHLDYYGNFQDYVLAKTNICRFQSKQDFIIFNQHNQILVEQFAQLTPAKQLNFSYQDNVRDNWIVVNNEAIVDLDTIPVIGRHTVTNTLPAVVIAKHLGIKNSIIATSLQSFKSLPHRLELVKQINNISYYNDSLSTTPVATIAAIKSFNNRPIILIVGGFDRGLDFSELAQTIVDRQIKHLILLPDTGERILKEIKKRLTHNMGELAFSKVNSMKQAVEVAKKYAKPGDIVLMSPASASFNLFKNYKDRGEQFINQVLGD